LHKKIGALLAVVLLFSSFGFSQVGSAGSSATTELVSVAYDGSQANGGSGRPSISADARYIAFNSEASNLVVDDTNGYWDVFVRDRQSGTTELVSIASDGSQGNGNSIEPAITPDGRFVVFLSEASKLVDGDTNNFQDIFVHDRQSGITERVNVASDGTQANDISNQPVISGNGRFVAFVSQANNLGCGFSNHEPRYYLHDRENNTTECPYDWYGVGAFSADSRYVLLYTDVVTGWPGAAIYDLLTGSYEDMDIDAPVWCTTYEVHRTWGISISDDLRYVLIGFECLNQHYDVHRLLVRDRLDGSIEEIYLDYYITGGTLSQDGRFVVWGPSYSSGHIFGFDRHTRIKELISVSFDGLPGNGLSNSPSVSGDGRYVAFSSDANNLVAGDTNGFGDVFIRDRGIESTYWTYYLPFMPK
jgi:hypothetical protein